MKQMCGGSAALPPSAAMATGRQQRSEKSGEFPTWSEIFPPTRLLVPLDQDPEFKAASPTIVRGLFVDLASVVPLLAERREPRGPLEIHADVLRIIAPVRFAVTALTIHARRIEVSAGAALIMDNRTDETAFPCTMAISTGGLALERPEAPLQIDFLGLEQVLTPEETPGHIRLECAVNGSGQNVITGTSTDEITPGDALLGALQLLTAKRLEYTPNGSALDPAELALHMARWVNRCHAQRGGDPRLAAESAVLVEHLRGAQLHLHVVPYLRLGEYYDLATDTATALEAVERQSERFFDRDASIGERQAAAQEMLEHYRNAQRFSQKLLEQAKTDMEEAQQASDTSAVKLDTQLQELTAAQANFEAGRKRKEEELKQEAAWAIIGAVVAVGIGVAVACTGNPAGAAGAVAAAKGVEEVAKQVSTLQQIIQKIAKAIETIKKLKVAVDTLKAIHDAIKKHLDTRALVEKLQTLQEQAAPGESTTAADWDVFCIDMRGLFKTPIGIGIDGAEDYLNTLERLAIRGKDAIDTGFHFTRCGQEYQQRLWEADRDQADVQLVESRIRQLDAQRGPDFTMMMFYERLRNQLKLQLIQAIENVGAAYRYYALREPSYMPSITSTGAELQKLLAAARSELVGAKEAFRPPPASWGPQVYRVWARTALEQFRAERRFSWAISLANFQGFDRIRIEEIRVWLIGTKMDKGQIQIRIATSGIYRDRLGGQTFEFATDPLRRTFAYQPVQESPTKDHRGQPVQITAKADDVEQSYFQPSPFTTWEISVPESLNTGLNLEGISEIGLEFYGSYIGSLMRAVPSAKGVEAPIDITIL